MGPLRQEREPCWPARLGVGREEQRSNGSPPVCAHDACLQATRLQWQDASDLPPTFLEEIASEGNSAKLLAEAGWSVSAAAAREDSPGDVVLELLSCNFSSQALFGSDWEGKGSNPTGASPEPHRGFSVPNSPAPSSSFNLRGFSACSTTGAISAYRHFLNQGLEQGTGCMGPPGAACHMAYPVSSFVRGAYTL